MKKSFKFLNLNKKTIAKLNSEQLNTVKGGNRSSQVTVVHCNDNSASMVRI